MTTPTPADIDRDADECDEVIQSLREEAIQRRMTAGMSRPEAERNIDYNLAQQLKLRESVERKKDLP